MNIAPYPDNDCSEWVIEFIEQPRVEDNFLQYSYAVYASQSSKAGGDPAFLYNSHKSQARVNHQRIVTNLTEYPEDETMNHVSGLTVKSNELQDFMENADEAYRWQVGDQDRLTNWQDDRGRELLPFHFPSYNGVNQALDPQWARERFRVEQDEHVRHLIRDQYFPSVMERRLTGDHRGTTLDLIVGASADDLGVNYRAGLGVDDWYTYGTGKNQGFIAYVGAGREFSGMGHRFTNVTIDQGATISAAYITATSHTANTANCHSRIVGEDVDDAATFSSLGNYQERRGTACGGANDNGRTSASVDWNSVPSFTYPAGDEFDSPSITAIVQEIVNRSGWSNGNAMAYWWDDHDDRTVAPKGRRWFEVYDSVSADAMQIHIEFVNPPSAAVTGEIGNGATEQAVRSAT